MIILRDLFLALALSQADGLALGGGEADELRAQAPLRGAARDPEGLEDLRRRLPPSTLQETEKQEPPPAPAPRNAAPEETPSVDFSWLELYPAHRAGGLQLEVPREPQRVLRLRRPRSDALALARRRILTESTSGSSPSSTSR
jgi:hypothetical protein